MSFKRPVCLFWLKASNPTEEEWEAAEELRGTFDVKFRNAQFADNSREPCDVVAGAVPDAYAGVKRPDEYEKPRKTLAKAPEPAKATGGDGKPAGWGNQPAATK